jgi:ribonuclease P protein subunit POP4
MVSLKDSLRSEFIGNQIKIIEAKNSSLIGLEGKVINESKNMLTIDTGSKTKSLIKNQITFMFKGKKIVGENISSRPEERIKK